MLLQSRAVSHDRTVPTDRTGQCSAYHEMVVLDLVWTTDPGNSSAVGNGEEALETGENMGGAVYRSVAQDFD